MKPITVLRASLPFESSPTGEESSEVPLDGGASSAELCELSLSDPLSHPPQAATIITKIVNTATSVFFIFPPSLPLARPLLFSALI